MKPYYEDSAVTIYHGDCREILPSLKADAMLTDPPYGADKADWDKEFTLPPCVPCNAMALIPGIWNFTRCPTIIDGLIYRWTLSAHLVNGRARATIGFGNWIPCLLYSKPDLTLYSQRSDSKLCIVNLEPKQNHPSPKPLTIIRWFLSWLPGTTVIDPFMGSGSTLRAAKDTGRKAIGIDINERYCEIAAKRMAQEVFAFA